MGEDEAEVDAYFAPAFAFHGPDGADADATGIGDCSRDGLPSRFAPPVWKGH
jgi:hypothetical protein